MQKKKKKVVRRQPSLSQDKLTFFVFTFVFILNGFFTKCKGKKVWEAIKEMSWCRCDDVWQQ